MTVTWRKPYPGETCFGGGKGVLIPYRLDRTSSSAEPSKDAAASSSTPREADPMQGAAPLGLYDIVKDLNGLEPDIEMLTTIFRRAIKLHSEEGQQQGVPR